MFKLSGCYPSPWQDIGEYPTILSAICAMASYTNDYDNMTILDTSLKQGYQRVAHYTKDGIK
jgi:hypothetical protein